MRAVQRGIVTAAIGDRDARAIVAAGQRKRPLLGQRNRIGRKDAEIIVAKVDVGLNGKWARGECAAVRREIRRLRLLHESRAPEIAACPDDELMRIAIKLAVRRELCADAPARLVNRRAIVGGLVRLRHASLWIRLAVIVVDVAAEVARPVAAVIGIAAEQQRIA